MSMKLYRIWMTHYAPKDSESAIKEYVVSTKDRDVFEYLAHGYAYWEDMIDDYDEDEYWKILANKGDEREVYDLYYGATQYSWEEVELVDEGIIPLMIKNSLAKEIEELLETK